MVLQYSRERIAEIFEANIKGAADLEQVKARVLKLVTESFFESTLCYKVIWRCFRQIQLGLLFFTLSCLFLEGV